jgi:hypothetical protein
MRAQAQTAAAMGSIQNEIALRETAPLVWRNLEVLATAAQYNVD